MADLSFKFYLLTLIQFICFFLVWYNPFVRASIEVRTYNGVFFFIIRTMVSFFNDLLLAKMFIVQIWIEPGGLIRFGPWPIKGPGLDEAGPFGPKRR